MSNARSKYLLAFAAMFPLSVAAPLAAQAHPVSSNVQYHATIQNVKYVYATTEPIAHVPSGGIIETNTLDAFGNVLQKPGDTLSMVKGDNPLTGPFFVEGAQPGDTPPLDR